MADGQQSISTELVTQILHRSVATVGTVTVAVLIGANWLLAHLATDWVMPSEVTGSLQQAISSLVTLWIFSRALKKYGAVAAAAFEASFPQAMTAMAKTSAAETQEPKP